VLQDIRHSRNWTLLLLVASCRKVITTIDLLHMCKVDSFSLEYEIVFYSYCIVECIIAYVQSGYFNYFVVLECELYSWYNWLINKQCK